MIPLIVITGPTASGKTDIAIRLAQRYGGEIVCADSRTVYKGLDIGTAKPTEAERMLVPHHLLDMVEPDEAYNLARFQRDALAAIADIRARGKVPFLVGGSGLYIDSVVLEYELGAEPDPDFRAFLEAKTLDELFRYCNDNNIKLPNNLYNKRYVIRAIEQDGINSVRKAAPDESTKVFAIKIDSDKLKQRIQQRAEKMFESGLVKEAQSLADTYGWEVAPLHAPEYVAVRRLLSNEISMEQAVESLSHDEWQIARKQMTWMRRNPWINWTDREHMESAMHSILAHVVL